LTPPPGPVPEVGIVRNFTTESPVTFW
jgi:hypothetical protein